MRLISYYLLISLLLTGCDDNKKNQKPPAALVGVTKTVRKNIPYTIEAPGRITGSLEIQIRSQVSGILKARLFDEGQYIKEGEKLFEIDQEKFIAALNRAKGSLAQAESELRRTKRDYNRMQNLFSKKAISPKQHDDALSAYEGAQANLNVAKGSLKEAEINLANTVVKAPISGIVGKEAQSIGNLINQNDQSSVLTSMVKISPLHVSFSIPVSTWNSLNSGMQDGTIKNSKVDDFLVEIVMPNGEKYPNSGKIIFIDSNADDFTSSVLLKANLQTTDNEKMLLPGQFVRVKLIGAEYKNAIIIPSSALVIVDNKYMVYVVKPDLSVETRYVKATYVNNLVVVFEGLEDGEQVVSEGLLKTRPGQKVRIVTKDFSM